MNVAIKGSPHDFAKSVGLMGTFDHGKAYGRDGKKIPDLQDFAMDWQVDPEWDPILFNEPKGPQLPHQKCRMPGPAATARRRRLSLDSELVETAAKACAGKVDAEACMSDVMGTGDVDMALLY